MAFVISFLIRSADIYERRFPVLRQAYFDVAILQRRARSALPYVALTALVFWPSFRCCHDMPERLSYVHIRVRILLVIRFR